MSANGDRLAKLLDEHAIPNTFTIGSLRAHIEQRRSRPLMLRPAPWCSRDQDAPSGVLVQATSADVIYYRKDTSLFHRLHIVLHEFGHLLCGHRPYQLNSSQFGFARSRRDEIEEIEAEYVAALLSLRVTTGPQPAQDTGLLSALGLADGR